VEARRLLATHSTVAKKFGYSRHLIVLSRKGFAGIKPSAVKFPPTLSSLDCRR